MARVRRFTREDIAETSRLRLSVRENMLSDPSLVTDELVESAVIRNGRGWVWEEDGLIKGFSIAILDPAHGGPRIWALFVAPGSEGRGIGRTLLKHAVDWLFESGAKRIELSTDPGTRAERVYLAAGWKPLGLTENGERAFELFPGPPTADPDTAS